MATNPHPRQIATGAEALGTLLWRSDASGSKSSPEQTGQGKYTEHSNFIDKPYVSTPDPLFA